MEGLIMRSTGSWYDVKTSGKEIVKARLRGKLKLEGKKITNPVAVGDYVVYETEKDGTAIITEIKSRENYIIRKSTRKKGHGHIIAANVDQAILMASLIFPRTSIGFIDRFLVSAESFRIPAKIIFNKSDLLNESLRELHEFLADLYKNLGYENILISTTEDKDLSQVEKFFHKKKSLLTGHSGVGKSTLLNRIKPDLDLAVGEVSTFANKGIHTTTFATMLTLDEDTYVIDTPGIKELGLIDMEPWEISHYFPEMREKLGECRFHNCLHINEPGCAVIKDLEEGIIADTRFDSYLSIMEDEDNRR